MSGPSSWRRAATVILAAGWAHSSPAGFRLLLLQRAQNQRFLPGAHVFPGGVLDAADRSLDWVSVFAPRYTPPRFGLGPEPPRQAPFPGLFHGDADPAALPDDVALRICAIREAFEESGVLLLRPRDSTPASQEPSVALSPPAGLADWRSRVRKDPRCFLQLCAHLDCTPDIWALHDWGGWLTPYGPSRRFDTTFLLCCLRETPRVEPDLAEVVGYKVGVARPAPRNVLSLTPAQRRDLALGSKGLNSHSTGFPTPGLSSAPSCLFWTLHNFMP